MYFAERGADTLRPETKPQTPKLWRPLAAMLQVLGQTHEEYRERNRLRALSARELRDMGISRADAELQAEKPLWRRAA